MPSNAPAGARQLMRKALAAPAKAAPRHSIKVEPEGIVRAIVAVTGVVDEVDDLIVPGGFTHTLSVRRPKVVDDHEWGRKAGRVLHIEEWLPGDSRLPKRTKEGRPWPAEAGALVATMQYNLASTAGRESYAWVKFYADSNEAEFSIGYKVPPGKARKRHDGVRVILMVDLFELSHVLFGAAPLSMALEVKNIHGNTAGSVTAPALNLSADDDDEDDTKLPPVDAKKPWETDEKRPKARMEAKSAAAVLADAQGIDVLEVKQARMRGSYEERTRLIEGAVLDLLNAAGDDCYGWVNPVATYDHEVIVTAYLRDDQGEHSYVIPYTFNAVSGTVELEEAQPVELSVVANVPASEQGPESAESHEPPVPGKPFDTTIRMLETMWGATEGKAADHVKAGVLALAARMEGKGGDGVVWSIDHLPEGDFELYSKTEPIEALRLDGAFTVDTREGRVTTDDGWLALDSGGYPYPIAADEFDTVYEPYQAQVEAPSPTDNLETKAPAPVAAEDDPDVAGEPAVEPEETVTIAADEHFADMEELHADDEKPTDEDDEHDD